MINNSVDYRGIKVDKMALECDKKTVDEFIDKLYQPERTNPEDANVYVGRLLDCLNWCEPTTSICDVPSSANK